MHKFVLAPIAALAIACHPAPPTSVDHRKTASASTSEPLTEDDRRELRTTCKPLFDQIGDLRRQRSNMSEDDARRRTEGIFREPPPGMAPEVFGRCRSLFQRAMVAYLAESKEIEALAVLRIISEDEERHFAETKALCPSAAPVLATMPRLADPVRRSMGSEWSDAGWTCLGFAIDGETTRFQYEVKATASDFTAYARALGASGRVVEITLGGRIEDGVLVIAPRPTRTERAP